MDNDEAGQAARRQRIADYVKGYRDAHPRYTHAYIDQVGGPTGPVITRIENAEKVKPFSLTKLERALDLPEGTLARVADDEPLEQIQPTLGEFTDDELLGELRRRLEAARPRARQNEVRAQSLRDDHGGFQVRTPPMGKWQREPPIATQLSSSDDGGE